jgi:hypothetical protein
MNDVIGNRKNIFIENKYVSVFMVEVKQKRIKTM